MCASHLIAKQLTVQTGARAVVVQSQHLREGARTTVALTERNFFTARRHCPATRGIGLKFACLTPATKDTDPFEYNCFVRIAVHALMQYEW